MLFKNVDIFFRSLPSLDIQAMDAEKSYIRVMAYMIGGRYESVNDLAAACSMTVPRTRSALDYALRKLVASHQAQEFIDHAIALGVWDVAAALLRAAAEWARQSLDLSKQLGYLQQLRELSLRKLIPDPPVSTMDIARAIELQDRLQDLRALLSGGRMVIASSDPRIQYHSLLKDSAMQEAANHPMTCIRMEFHRIARICYTLLQNFPAAIDHASRRIRLLDSANGVMGELDVVQEHRTLTFLLFADGQLKETYTALARLMALPLQTDRAYHAQLAESTYLALVIAADTGDFNLAMVASRRLDQIESTTTMRPGLALSTYWAAARLAYMGGEYEDALYWSQTYLKKHNGPENETYLMARILEVISKVALGMAKSRRKTAYLRKYLTMKKVDYQIPGIMLQVADGIRMGTGSKFQELLQSSFRAVDDLATAEARLLNHFDCHLWLEALQRDETMMHVLRENKKRESGSTFPRWAIG